MYTFFRHWKKSPRSVDGWEDNKVLQIGNIFSQLSTDDENIASHDSERSPLEYMEIQEIV